MAEKQLKKVDAMPIQQAIDLDPETVKKYIAKGATDEELFMFLGICRAYGLNPFKREIHFVKYDKNSPGIPIVGYETYLKRAVATGKLDGWRVWIEGKGENEKAVIEIHRKDWSRPFRWEVYRREFDTGRSSWKKMPHFMLRKVAIAQGFRLAFPEDLGGMPYIPEEIAMDGEVISQQPVVHEEPAAPSFPEETEQTEKDRLIAEIMRLKKEGNISDEKFASGCFKLLNVRVQSEADLRTLSVESLRKLINAMRKRMEAKNGSASKSA